MQHTRSAPLKDAFVIEKRELCRRIPYQKNKDAMGKTFKRYKCHVHLGKVEAIAVRLARKKVAAYYL